MIDWNLALGFAGIGLVLVGGFVKLRVDQAKGFALVGSRLDKIETRLEIDDKGKADRDSARRLEMADVARAVIRERQTNPAIPIYPPE